MYTQAIEINDRSESQSLWRKLVIFFQCSYHNGSFVRRMSDKLYSLSMVKPARKQGLLDQVTSPPKR